MRRAGWFAGKVFRIFPDAMTWLLCEPSHPVRCNQHWRHDYVAKKAFEDIWKTVRRQDRVSFAAPCRGRGSHDHCGPVRSVGIETLGHCSAFHSRYGIARRMIGLLSGITRGHNNLLKGWL